MLKPEPPSEGRSLVVKPLPVEVVLYEDGLAPHALVLPPYDDMADIASLAGKNFSFRELAHGAHHIFIEAHRDELERLEEKQGRFGNSSTYWHRLADLAAAVDELELEGNYLKNAVDLEPDEFALNRMGESLIARGYSEEAEKLLLSLDLKTNLHANLRLAAFHVGRRELEAASQRVADALTIDPFEYGARLFDGALKLWSGRYLEAILSFKVAVEERPNSAVAHTNLAVAYLLAGRKDRALQALKKAVAFDPLNSGAVSLLADLAFTLKVSEDAIPSLRYFLRFEQKNSGMWERLARALLAMKEYNEAIAALKRQASVEERSEVWNNLGVVYHLKNDNEKALESFKRAMLLSQSVADRSFCMAAKNLGAVLQRFSPPEETLNFIKQVLLPQNESLICSDSQLSQLFLIELNALTRSRGPGEAAKLGEDLLKRADSNEQLKGWVVVGLLAHYALNRRYIGRAIELAKDWVHRLGGIKDAELRMQMNNNIAFAFVEAGMLQEARYHLSELSSRVHKSPYATATLGLYHLRRGNVDRGSELYREAIGLCIAWDDKVRIRQKWNLEWGKILLGTDLKRALKFLQKASMEKEGERPVAEEATEVLLRMAPAAVTKLKK